MAKLADEIWDEESLIYFRNVFGSAEGRDVFVNMLFELGFFDNEVGQTIDGNVTLESSIAGSALRNYATTLLRRLALNNEEEFRDMLAGLLNSVTPIHRQKEKK